jgi:hypothetical protein
MADASGSVTDFGYLYGNSWPETQGRLATVRPAWDAPRSGHLAAQGESRDVL